MLTILLGAAPPTHAEDKERAESPIVFTADELTYDRELAVTRASGNVEVYYGERLMRADAITYNERQDLMTASGNVALVEPGGEVLFAEHVEVTGDLKNGVIMDMRAILSDGARFAAGGARRTEGYLTDMRRAVYSPCDLCPEDPRRAPLWQIKAVRVVHDQQAKQIEYRHAWFELAGVPVVYTPYILHPDPTVKRQSGFMLPVLGRTSYLGAFGGVPYYWVINDHSDATITPVGTSEQRGWLGLQYRRAFAQGKLTSDGSLTYDSSNMWRGHVFSDFRQDIDSRWRGGLDVKRASDRTYLRQYRYQVADRNLRSRAFAEGFYGRDYLVLNGYSFQQQANVPFKENTPVVLPLADYAFFGPEVLGGQTYGDLGTAVVSRVSGTQSRRVSGRAGWELPFHDDIGGVYKLAALVRGDGYQVVDAATFPDEVNTFTGLTGRVLPQASLEWRLPFIRTDASRQHIVQPIAEFIAAPIVSNNKIPNEDSRDFEFSEVNLFGFQRFPGYDRVESGSRVNYGLEWQVLGAGGRAAVFNVGQSYRLPADATFPPGSGFDRNPSDIVGTAQLSWSPWLSLDYRVRVNAANGVFGRNEFQLNLKPGAVKGYAGYTELRTFQNNSIIGREEVNFGFDARLTRHWSATSRGIYDLGNNGELLQIGAGLAYEDECFFFDAFWFRNRFEDVNLAPTNGVFFRVTLKTLGEVGARF